jgi:hypothetical protein
MNASKNTCALFALLFFVVQAIAASGQTPPPEESTPPLVFTPEEHGRRQMSVHTIDNAYHWRLRIPERVFCDEAVPVGHDIHRVHTRVTWKHEPSTNRWEFTRDNVEDTPRKNLPVRIEYGLKVEPCKDGARLTLTVKNIGDQTLHNLTGHVCLGHLTRPFRDPHFSRTFFRQNGKFLSLKNTDRGKDPIRAHYRVRDQKPIKIFNDPNNRFWGGLSPEVTDSGLILTQSEDGQRLVALWFEHASEVFQNSDEPNMCMHSDPSFGDLEPDQQVRRVGRIILFEGDLAEFEKQYLRNEPGVLIPDSSQQ